MAQDFVWKDLEEEKLYSKDNNAREKKWTDIELLRFLNSGTWGTSDSFTQICFNYFLFFYFWRKSPPLKESTISETYGLNEVFQFSICVFALYLSPQYLGACLLYLLGKVHMCLLCKGDLADLGLDVAVRRAVTL